MRSVLKETTQTKATLESGSQTNGRSWSEVVRRGNRSNTMTSTRPPRRIQASNRQRSSNSRSNNQNQPKKPPGNWIKVDGARKIWGTLRSCTAASVKSAISRVCKNDTVKVKRKFKTGVQTRWWFVLHDSEAVLASLESNWGQLEVQTSWKLVNCYMPQFACEKGDDQASTTKAGDQMQTSQSQTSPTEQSLDRDTYEAGDQMQTSQSQIPPTEQSLDGDTHVVNDSQSFLEEK